MSIRLSNMLSIDEAFKQHPNIGRNELQKVTGISQHEARIQCRIHKGKRSLVDMFDEDDVKLGVAIGDIHYPYHNDTVDICRKFCQDKKIEYFLMMGDQMDFDTISVFNRKKPLLKEGKRLQKEYDGFQRDILDSFKDVVSPSGERYFVTGNHDSRPQRLIESQPELQGMVEPENCLELQGWRVIPENHAIKIGEMNFIHGIYYNKYHATTNVQNYGKNIFSWHVHTTQVFTMHSPVDALPKQGVSVGCACNLNPEYLREAPSAWVNQFLIFYLFPDGSFTYYTPIIIKGRAVIDGKIFKK